MEPAPLPSRFGSGAAWVVAAMFALGLAVLAFFHFREAPAPASPTVRFQVTPPDRSTIDYFKLSPDGRSLAFIAGSRLWIRALDSLQSRPLVGTEGASQMFWSPDNQFVAFFAAGKLKKIPAAGGPVQVICSVTEPSEEPGTAME